MSILNVLTLLGGLAFFLYGMNAMGDGLEKLSGGNLEKTLEKMTSNVFKGVLLGALVTAVIQSSAATTVMVVGFVNSGIMQLGQAVGVIMGANIGTTITAWILSLSGIEGDNVVVQLFKPSSFSPVLAFIGILLMMAAKSQKKKDIGNILMGFALLMYGMETMSNAVKPLAGEAWFERIFLVIAQNPLLGILVGTLLTAIMQSSSASVGVLQAFSMTGKITFSGAVPIILGQNIGSCITALISCIGAKKNAKRAALIHLYFNIVGVIAFSAIFYGLNAVLKFSFFNEIIGASGIAIVHTTFNVFSTLLLLPFNKLLVKLAEITIKDKDEVSTSPFLDERFLSTPAIATEQCSKLTDDMLRLTKEAIFKAFECLDKYSREKADFITEAESRADIYEDVLGSYLVKLSAKNLSQKDSREVARLLHSIGDLERMSDHAVAILGVAKEMYDKKISFSDDAHSEIQTAVSAVKRILDITTEAILTRNISLAHDVEPLEQVIDDLKAKMKKRHIYRLRNGKCTIELGFVFSDLLSNLERISDLCSNIAAYMIELKEQKLDTHEYSQEMRESSSDFAHKYQLYKEEYKLPPITKTEDSIVLNNA